MTRGPTSSVTISSASAFARRRLFFQPRYSTTSTGGSPGCQNSASPAALVPPGAAGGAAGGGAGGADPPAGRSCGRSLLPMIVRFNPTCTVTSCPATSTCIFSLTFQPSDPVENSLAAAVISLPLMTTLIGLAAVRNCSRVIGSGALDDLAIR